jgi:hypothetical protein
MGLGAIRTQGERPAHLPAQGRGDRSKINAVALTTGLRHVGSFDRA